MDSVVNLRKNFKNEGINFSINDIIVKAVATALNMCPDVHVIWKGDQVCNRATFFVYCFLILFFFISHSMAAYPTIDCWCVSSRSHKLWPNNTYRDWCSCPRCGRYRQRGTRFSRKSAWRETSASRISRRIIHVNSSRFLEKYES